MNPDEFADALKSISEFLVKFLDSNNKLLEQNLILWKENIELRKKLENKK